MGSRARTEEPQPPTQEQYEAMTRQQKTAWKKRDPLRYPLNPPRWTCPDCGADMQWSSKVMH